MRNREASAWVAIGSLYVRSTRKHPPPWTLKQGPFCHRAATSRWPCTCTPAGTPCPEPGPDPEPAPQAPAGPSTCSLEQRMGWAQGLPPRLHCGLQHAHWWPEIWIQQVWPWDPVIPTVPPFLEAAALPWGSRGMEGGQRASRRCESPGEQRGSRATRRRWRRARQLGPDARG